MNIGNLSKTEFNVLIDALDQYVCDLEDIEGMEDFDKHEELKAASGMLDQLTAMRCLVADVSPQERRRLIHVVQGG